MILFIIHSFIIFCIVNIIIISLFVERILKLRKNGERLNLKKIRYFWIILALSLLLIGQLGYSYIYKPLYNVYQDKKFVDIVVQRDENDSLYDVFDKISQSHEVAFFEPVASDGSDISIYYSSLEQNLSFCCLIKVDDLYYQSNILFRDECYIFKFVRDKGIEETHVLSLGDFNTMYGEYIKLLDLDFFEKVTDLNVSSNYDFNIEIKFESPEYSNLSSIDGYVFRNQAFIYEENINLKGNYYVRIDYTVQKETYKDFYHIILI